VCVMQSTSIEKNDTLNYIEKTFFLLFGTNRVMRWCAKTNVSSVLEMFCACASKKKRKWWTRNESEKEKEKRRVQWRSREHENEGRKKRKLTISFASVSFLLDVNKSLLKQNLFKRSNCHNRKLIENLKYSYF